jgi:hypothetical protein
MSGVAYDYGYEHINSLADSLSPHTDGYEWLRRRMADALRDVAHQCKDIEWMDSSDTGPEGWEGIKEWLDQHKF